MANYGSLYDPGFGPGLLNDDLSFGADALPTTSFSGGSLFNPNDPLGLQATMQPWINPNDPSNVWGGLLQKYGLGDGTYSNASNEQIAGQYKKLFADPAFAALPADRQAQFIHGVSSTQGGTGASTDTKGLLGQLADPFKAGIGAIRDDPTRLLTGIDPVSTDVSNALLGQNNAAITNFFGTPSATTWEQTQKNNPGINYGDAQGAARYSDILAGLIGGGVAGGSIFGGASPAAPAAPAAAGAANVVSNVAPALGDTVTILGSNSGSLGAAGSGLLGASSAAIPPENTVTVPGTQPVNPGGLLAGATPIDTVTVNGTQPTQQNSASVPTTNPLDPNYNPSQDTSPNESGDNNGKPVDWTKLLKNASSLYKLLGSGGSGGAMGGGGLPSLGGASSQVKGGTTLMGTPIFGSFGNTRIHAPPNNYGLLSYLMKS